MHRGKTQHFTFRKLFTGCWWGYGGRYGWGPDHVVSGTLGLCPMVAAGHWRTLNWQTMIRTTILKVYSSASSRLDWRRG